MLKEAYQIKQKYGKKTTRAQAIKRGFKSQIVSKKKNNKSLLGS